MDLPPALSDVPLERRQRLLGRANRELQDREYGGWMPAGTDGLLSVFAFLLLGDAFLMLLLAELDGKTGSLGWGVIFSPLFLLDGLWFARDIRRAKRCWDGEGEVTAHLVAYRLLHTTCLVCTKVLVLLRLCVVAKLQFMVLLCPMWVSAILGTAILCTAPIPPRVEAMGDAARREYLTNMWNAGFFHLMAYGLQLLLVGLKLDHLLSASWTQVCVPAYLALVLLVILLATSSLHLLGAFCPTIIRFREMSSGGRMLVVLLVLALLLIWGWIFALFASFNSLLDMLDTPNGTSFENILVPLIAVMTASLIMFTSLSVVFFLCGGSEAALAATGTARTPAVTLETIPGPIMLLRQSSTYFRRVTENIGQDIAHVVEETATRARGDSDAGASKLCYVCEGAPADAVLLECGHAGICYQCARGLAESMECLCPMCRKEIVSIVKLPAAQQPGTEDQRYVRSEEGFNVAVRRM